MIKSRYHVLGVMSGTSLDGIDIAYITFDYNSKWTFKIHASETISYSEYWLEKLTNLVAIDLQTLQQIDKAYTIYLAEIISNFIQKYQLSEIDAICSHGHTAWHKPEDNFTYQIGNLPELARLTGHLVVCDFRTQDVSLKGQGAPLVPIGDQLLFSDYDYCINLGGFANISSESNGNRIAYDICPVNIVMNRYAKKLGYEYDRGGEIARSGVVDSGLLETLNRLRFYAVNPPKSLGLEWVETHVFPVLEHSKLSEQIILRTVVEHIAIQITKTIKPNSKAFFTGGGSYNHFLLERIKAHKVFDLIVPSKEIIEFKEALIFGLLGVLKLRGEVNCLASVTGAIKDHSSGVQFYP
ncbi:anhydro-N-acetylmuramic acid kinase [Psychroserpens sp. SPM9]|uniref:anhydro-N-acetylmuramic acid kinase n=1 Tax=Psychroserpens sp. SPM9 TaxID=2975598 RepID=UPI0021A5F406|nr:anhydro-N-acetylmuramic acid kinase [Psychroserpens sp. SPM9]MDG5492317.1 anhydro-N-acetylmuramic acid kinase [Psychroserpens sp. SPM9]